MVRNWVWAGVVTTTLGVGCGEVGSKEAPASLNADRAGAASARSQEREGAPSRDDVSGASKDEAAAPNEAFGLDGSGEGKAGAKSRGPGRGLGGNQPAPQAADPGDAQPRADTRAQATSAPAAPPPLKELDKYLVPPKGGRPAVQQASDDERPPAHAQGEAPIDPNGRFATTYRPGGGHLAAFESAVAAGIVPASEREIAGDIGARYAPALDAPKEGALRFEVDFERNKLAPSGGPLHLRMALRSSSTKASDRPQLSVVVVMDVSGSMRGKLIESARDAASQLVDKLEPTDDFSVVTFSTDANVKIPIGRVGSRKAELKKAIGEIVEGGGTNIGGGLQLAYEQMASPKVSKDSVRVVMLMSDGRANEGITNQRALASLALEAFQKGIQTSSFGLGTDYDGPLMSQIAGDGAGGYYYLRDAAQVPASLTTELEKRLDPVATAVEVRVRLKPSVELLNVYGSRRLGAAEAARVRAVEVAEDQHTQKRDGIKSNRKDDVEGGMRFFMPAFARDDSHALLLKVRLPEGVGQKDIALVEVKYKDRLLKKNVTTELPIKIAYANSDAESAASQNPSVARTVQGFAAGEALMKAAALIGQSRNQQAIDLLGEREGLLHHAAFTLDEPLFVEDAKRLARLRVHAAGRGQLRDPLVVAMMMETAGSVHLR